MKSIVNSLDVDRGKGVSLTPDDACEHFVIQSLTPEAGKLSEPQAKPIALLESLKVLQLSQKPEFPSSKLQKESWLQGEYVEHRFDDDVGELEVEHLLQSPSIELP